MKTSYMVGCVIACGLVACGGDSDPSDPDLGMTDMGGQTPDLGPVDMGPPPACVTVERLGAGGTPASLPDGIVGEGGIRITNDVIVAGFSGLDQHGTAGGSGGQLVDLHPIGGEDQLPEHWILGGADTDARARFVNTSISVTTEEDDRAVVTIAGTYDPLVIFLLSNGVPAPDALTITTDYEIRCGEPLVEMRSTMTFAGAGDGLSAVELGVLDVILWGNAANQQAFCPVEGQGPECAAFALPVPSAAYIGSTGSETGEVSYAYYPISTFGETPGETSVVNSTTQTALGFLGTSLSIPQTITNNRVWEYDRALVVGDRSDTASAVDIVLEKLEELGRVTTGTVSGTVTPPTGGFSGVPQERPLVLLATPGVGGATDPATWTPSTMVRVATDGTFSARVPVGDVSYEVRSFEHEVVRGAGGTVAAGANTDLGAIAINEHPAVNVTVTLDGAAAPARITIVGTGGTLDPELSAPTGAGSQGNVALADGNGMVSVLLPAGEYDVYASHGLNASLDRESITVGTTDQAVSLDLVSLGVVPSGFLTGDFHVHSAVSFDSSTPPETQLHAFLAAGVDALVATEHDVVYDYAPALTTLESRLPAAWRGRVKAFPGLEATAFVPYVDWEHTIGHYNVFPVDVRRDQFENGAPNDERIEPGELYDALRMMAGPANRIIQMNHVRSPTEGQLWLGYFDSCQFDPTMSFAANSGCLGTSAGGTTAFEADAMEVINYKDVEEYLSQNRDWHALLLEGASGYLPTGTANSDSHRVYNDEAGFPVNVMRTDDTLADLDGAALVDLVQGGAMSGALGVFVWMEVCDDSGANCGEPSKMALASTTTDIQVRLRVAAAPWAPVEMIRVRVGGSIVATLVAGVDFTAPSDPFSTTAADAILYDSIDGSDAPIVVAAVGSTDTIVTAEAGFAIPAYADLDADGVIDATDADGNGSVDGGETTVVLPTPPEPFSLIVRGALPLGFVNPVFLSRDGNAVYDPPGMPLVE